MANPKQAVFLCRDFRFAYFVAAARRSFVPGGMKAVFYCLRPTPGWVCALARRLSLGRIEARPLPSHLAAIGRSSEDSVRKKVYVEILSDISRKLSLEVSSSRVGMIDGLDGKLGRLKGALALCLEQEILAGVADDFVLVEVGRWLLQNACSPLRGSGLTVLLDRENYWDELAGEHGNRTGVACLIVPRRWHKSWGIRIVYCLTQLAAECIFSLASSRRRQDDDSQPRIGIPYYSHANFTNFQEKRNYYLFWFPESGVDPRRILIYSDGALDIPQEERDNIQARGFSLLQANGILGDPLATVPRHRCRPGRVAFLLGGYLRQLARLALHVRSRLQWEQWKLLAILLIKIPYWEDFFLCNRVRVKFRFHPCFSHRDIAAQLAGAVALSYQYSNHSLETLSPLHRDISDVYFIWGKSLDGFFLNGGSSIKSLVHTGYIFDHAFRLKGRAASLRQRFVQSGSKFVLSVMDENIIGVYREGMLDLYSALLKFMQAHPDIGLLIKPKSDRTRGVLASNPATAEAFAAMEKVGRVEVLPSCMFPVEVGMASDLAIGVYADSTAVLECALAGVPSVAYECCFGTRRMDGLRRYVYYDMEAFLRAILDHKSGKTEMGGKDCWTGLLEEKDPFRDGRAADRVGSYISALLQAFDSGHGKEAALRLASASYAKGLGSAAPAF